MVDLQSGAALLHLLICVLPSPLGIVQAPGLNKTKGSVLFSYSRYGTPKRGSKRTV